MAKVMLVNRKKRGRKGKKVAVAKRKSPVRRRSASRRKTKTVKFKRNPSPRNIVTNVVDRQLRPAAIQAAGALALDVIYGYLSKYIPVNFQAGALRHFTKGVVAVGISAVASNLKLAKAAVLNDAAKGALTIVMHDAGKELMTQFAPQLPLGYISPFPVARLGKYVRPAAGGRVALPSPSRLQGTSRRLGKYIRTGGSVPEPEFNSAAIE
jgi:hypothetical protein